MSLQERERELEAQGWTRRFVACEPRLSEAVQLYRDLGYEVHLEPLPDSGEDGECRTCLEVNIDRYRIIYTRPAEGRGPFPEDELF